MDQFGDKVRGEVEMVDLDTGYTRINRCWSCQEREQNNVFKLFL